MLAAATLARPYARAAFDVAAHKEAVDDWSRMLELASQVVSSASFGPLLGHPKIGQNELLAVFGDVLGEAADAGFSGFLKVLMHYRRLDLLPEITAQFEALKRAREHKLKVSVTSAIELDADQLGKLGQRLQQRFGSDIEMETQIDDSLIGGLIVRAGDKVIDASVRGRLEQLGRALVR
ncbi:MAG: F0F1 ATP synthase subunit delta [Wenzhouxiangellaceae bacterium]|nr:F0F1 ATP synthase subunit delta [Wenzhouxiangellaceae bacterium]